MKTITLKSFSAFLLLILGGGGLGVFFTVKAEAATKWGPWSNKPHTTITTPKAPADKDTKTPEAAKPTVKMPEPEEKVSWKRKLFRFYQKYVSSDDGAVCPHYPTCSAFALEALEKHGVILGSMLTIDRLFGEYPGIARSSLYRLITKNGIDRAYDPVPDSIF